MKVLMVNVSDLQGGAARASYRLHKALISSGVKSQMLVDTKLSDDYSVIGQDSNAGNGISLMRRVLDRLPINFYKHRSPTYFSPNLVPFSGLVKRINAINPDIVHLHWVNKAMLSISDIAAIKAPIVWSLHDMWAFTGGCHYDEECGAYKQSCGTCKVLGSVKSNDLSRKVFKKKLSAYAAHKSLTVVGLSKWLAECASKSTLFKNNKIVCLPNPIDTSVYLPLDKRIAREILGLSVDKKLILFGAMGATSDPRKGYKEFCEGLLTLKGRDIELVVFGSSQPKVSESLACGTPIVGFDIGGNGDMIEHQKNGYLAKPFDTTDLTAGIEWVLNAPNYDELSVNARNKVLNEFDSEVVAKQYIRLYESVLEKAKL